MRAAFPGNPIGSNLKPSFGRLKPNVDGNVTEISSPFNKLGL
jgi:hypothetical protein